MKFRKKQKQRLEGLIKDNVYVSPLLVYGPSSTGKTTLMQSVLKNVRSKAYIDCRLINSKREIFNELIYQLFNYNICRFHGYINCIIQDVDQFLKFLVDTIKIKEKTFYLVFDRFTVLKEFGNSLLPGFIRMNDSLRCNGTKNRCCVILIDQSLPINFCHLIRAKEIDVLYLRFSQYKRNELISILKEKKFYLNLSQKHWNNIVRWMVNLFNYTRTITHYFYILSRLDLEIQKYYYLNEKKSTLFDVIRIKLKHIYKEYIKQKNFSVYKETKTNEIIIKKITTVQDISLSNVSKFLLIAGFIISQNGMKSYFKKYNYIKKKRIKKNFQKKIDVQKKFSLQSLLATFDILIRKEMPNFKPIDVLGQVTLLCKLDLFSYTNEDLNDLKLRCSMKLENILSIGNELGLNIFHYL